VDSRNVLLVCSGICQEVENCLQQAGCHVTRVNRGSAAVIQARHETLDAAVLISTESEMDLAEIALNLRDINPSIAIIFVSSHHTRSEDADPTDAIAHAIPRATVLRKGELGNYLDSPEWKGCA